MNEPVVADRAFEWRRLKSLVLDSVSSPITRRVYNLGLDEFMDCRDPNRVIGRPTVGSLLGFLQTRDPRG
jgi:hypothetical protein